MYHTNPLERGLQDLAYNLWKFRTSTPNPLYAHLPSTISVSLGGMPISMTLEPKPTLIDESWTSWGIIDDDTESHFSSDTSSDEFDFLSDERKGDDVKIDPWKTLLLLNDSAKKRAKEVAADVISTPQWSRPESEANKSDDGGLGSRRGSKELSAEEDERGLMKILIENCDTSKP